MALFFFAITKVFIVHWFSSSAACFCFPPDADPKLKTDSIKAELKGQTLKRVCYGVGKTLCGAFMQI